jgi:hypothetical protein
MSITTPLRSMESKPTRFKAVSRGIDKGVPIKVRFVFKGEIPALRKPSTETTCELTSTDRDHQGM